ncbi:zf-C2HC5-domain-containing protein [Westerdykella ornata]|uniref:Zf-C2HC5-domain-containing protein n=1 Tax=Westerdykella ornata TaxID=318751 RepID=A0A6A6JMY5_WESOR|nr:zf-C2HC5-domain-containing protein [Westerdykella ornata]KAF2277585.1 zf-C2HC5-domain-containing protein [Westerdykella ornata]
MDLTAWAILQLSKLLPLDDESLRQIVSYAESLPPKEAAEHLQNLLGDSPKALEFITSFNNRRNQQSNAASKTASGSSISEVPKAKPRKKKAERFGQLPPPRQPENYGDVSGGYLKPVEEDYLAASPRSRSPKPPAASQPPAQATKPAKLPPSAAGQLISDVRSSRNSSPKPKSKVTIQGGTPMHGASTVLSDLDAAIKSLEIQTNLTLSSAQDNERRKCNCMATRHPLLDAAPNCLNCGKIICVKEGIGPCTFCNTPLLSSSEIQSMVRVLKDERGKEKMAMNNASQRRAEVSSTPRPFSTPRERTPASSTPASDSENEKLTKAKQHRDKLLAFQAQNARRTQVHDEAADFETPTAGLSMWASPQERAMQLKRQQKALREQEWNSRPEYEKRKVVASLDLVGGKVVKRMTTVERPRTPEPDEDIPELANPTVNDVQSGQGPFSRNPLLGGLIRPTIRPDDKGKGKAKEGLKKQTWRRVQDDNEDNEQWILDGGAYGGQAGSSDQDH